MILLCLYS